FHERQCSGAAHRSLGFDRGPSPRRRGDPDRLYDTMGSGSVDFIVSRHRFRRASAARRHGQYDELLQEPRHGRWLSLRHQFRRGCDQLRRRCNGALTTRRSGGLFGVGRLPNVSSDSKLTYLSETDSIVNHVSRDFRNGVSCIRVSMSLGIWALLTRGLDAGVSSATKYNTLMLPRSLRSNLSAFLDRREIDGLSNQAVRQWSICDHDIICQRYDRIAAFIPMFEWAFFMPSGLRKRAVGQLKLRRGDRVLEVGCGTGRNFPYLREAVGP